MPNTDPSGASLKLWKALQGGVAFHISDLDPAERNVVEEQFRTKLSPIKVIAATTTLAMGVNTPAEAVIIAGITHPGDKPYSVEEYKNIAGLAGRLGFSTVISAFSNNVKEHWDITLRGKKTAACLLWMSNKSMAEIETYLMQHTIVDSAAGPVRSVTSRTNDILPVAAKIAEQLHPTLDLNNRLLRLLIRLEIGIPATLTDLAIITGKVLSRGDYLLLLQNSITSAESFNNAGTETTQGFLGGLKNDLAARKIEQYLKEKKMEPMITPLEAYES